MILIFLSESAKAIGPAMMVCVGHEGKLKAYMMLIFLSESAKGIGPAMISCGQHEGILEAYDIDDFERRKKFKICEGHWPCYDGLRQWSARVVFSISRRE